MTAAVEDSAALDEMFAVIEGMNVPGDYRAEIIEGEIVLNPQRKVHSRIIQLLTVTLMDALGRNANILWDVRVDFPGVLNGYVPDVALVKEGAEEDDNGNHSYRDVEMVAEVVSRGSRRDDYDAKLVTYARAGVPTYVIADPKRGFVHVHHMPKGDEYDDVSTYAFGVAFDLPGTGITIETTDWPRD
ncbi:Uma2 family endonuclease [Streptomyces sp. NPDC057654]|uniref:Uma2 family endonuclease n=1 Tax=Streptomyces sp. NPDC057654 TaxID=3346196 RepID=UPI00369B8F75